MISSSLRAEIVTEPSLTTRAGTATRTPTSRSVAVRRSRSVSGLDQDIGEDRHGLARLDDVVNHLETPKKRIAIHMDFHKRLQLLREEERRIRRRKRRRGCG